MSLHEHTPDAAQGSGPRPTHSAVECSEALLRVYEYLDGEMSSADHDKIAGHLDTCVECLRQYTLDTTLKAMVRRSCAPQEQAPQALRSVIMSRIQITVVRTDEA